MKKPAPNRDFLLISVQRSGTRFTQRMLDAAGIKTAQIHPVVKRQEQIEGWLGRNLYRKLPIIVPMRHPISVAKSWLCRAEPGEPDGFQIGQMLMQYWMLIRVCEVSRPLFLPVDHPERDHFLTDMQEALHVDLKTDWAKYGDLPDKPSADIELKPDELDQVMELVATEFVSSFYTEDVPHGT